ncbi:MAG: transcriptional regulator [Rhizobiales bacterium]|nr:transcriptional regulator [Hyphomicrobiales bacterium]
MKTHIKKRIEITIEAPLVSRVLAILDQQKATGYTVVPAMAGRGDHGRWDRDGLIGRAGSMVMVISIVDEKLVEPILTPLFALLSRQIGIVTVCDVQVVRPEHF